MAKRRRAIVLGEEVREPGKRIGDQKHRQYELGPPWRAQHDGRNDQPPGTSSVPPK